MVALHFSKVLTSNTVSNIYLFQKHMHLVSREPSKCLFCNHRIRIINSDIIRVVEGVTSFLLVIRDVKSILTG